MAYLFAMHPTNRIRELRKKAGLSQAELARIVGISQPAISQIENDTRPLTIDWMRSLARIFGVTAADILCDHDNPHRLSDEEQALLDNFRAADEAQRALIGRVAEPLQPFHGAEPAPDRRNAA